jgi:thiol:disulfide interchange protein DsbD
VTRYFLTLILGWAAFSGPTRAAVTEADLLPVDQAYPLSIEAVTADSVRIRWGIADGYYLYRHRMAVTSATPGITAAALQLPAGQKHRDEFFGDVETYRKAVTVSVDFDNPGNLGALELDLKYQGCADIGICYPPQSKRLRIPLPGAADPSVAAAASDTDLLGLSKTEDDALPEDRAFKAEAIVGDAETLLLKLTPAEGYYLYRDKLAFTAGMDGKPVPLGRPKLPEAVWYPDPEFGLVPVYFEPVEITLPLKRTGADAGSLALTLDYQGCKENGICYPPMQKAFTLELPAGGAIDFAAERVATRVAPTEAGSHGLLLAVLLALLGGLILNLMPCVLPVLSFKAMALAQAGKAGHARSHAIWYTAGVLSSFAALGLGVLALRAAGQSFGWGFQLQQPIVVGGLALLMFAIGLMMSGLFNWGSGLAGMGQSLTEKSGPAGDFFTGVLAVVVASPCTAPFMGSALAFAFTAHWSLALSVFLALGLGLALPFLLIGFIPALANRIPKPGAWMDTLKHWLAYPMYLTAVWLAWVFGNQKGVNGLGLLLISAIALSAALWWFERQKMQPSIRAKAVALLIGVLAAASFGAALQQAQPGKTQAAGSRHEVFSTQRLEALRAAGTPVFVDMTADWCITCKVNEKAVFQTQAFEQLLKESGTVYLVGDWTNQDPEISAYLDRYNTPGVPLYVVYPAGPGQGRKLPQLLTLDLMREALAAP